MDGLGEKILAALKMYRDEFNRKILKTSEEVEANTSDKYLVAAPVVGELITNLKSNPEWITDSTGKITGYKTAGGADTVFPFNSIVMDPESGNRYTFLTQADGGNSSKFIPKGTYFYYISDHGQAHSCHLPGSIKRSTRVGNIANIPYQSYATFGTVIVPDGGGHASLQSNANAGYVLCILYRLSD